MIFCPLLFLVSMRPLYGTPNKLQAILAKYPRFFHRLENRNGASQGGKIHRWTPIKGEGRGEGAANGVRRPAGDSNGVCIETGNLNRKKSQPGRAGKVARKINLAL